MKLEFHTRTFKCTVIAACAALGLSAVGITMAAAKDPQPPRHKHRVHRAEAVTPAHQPWSGPDPTRGPGMEQLRSLQRDGRCVIDEGYGRWMPCSNQ